MPADTAFAKHLIVNSTNFLPSYSADKMDYQVRTP
jgi:hypothetical protein